jgi:cob(I)alamin adenosyltransferase
MAQERPLLDAITSAQSTVSSVEARIKELGDKLNPMSGSFIFGATGSNDANEELQVREQMRQAEAQLVEARQALAAANQALQDFRQGRAPTAVPQT